LTAFKYNIKLNNYNIRLCFIVWKNSTSVDKSAADDSITLTAEVIRNAELELSGNSEEQQVRYGGEIKGEAAIVSFT
jgi:hypothetical protein